MTDETTLAFELPHVRAAATGPDNVLDRISVRDYTCAVEIGAFQAERGVTQRIRFNVVLEVSHNAAAQSDDVDQVLSYDTIIEAIENQLSTERINLLETMAERVAERVLEDPRAVRIFVRIEKLDRIPGALGVEIVRSRIETGDVVRPLGPPAAHHDDVMHPLVVFMPNSVLRSAQLPDWLNAIDGHQTPAIICLEMAQTDHPTSSSQQADRRIGLLSIEQNAWVLAGHDKRCVVVDSRTELDWAMKHGQLSVWAPSKVVLDAIDAPQASAETPLDLAKWFADQFSADALVVLGHFDGADPDGSLRVLATPNEFSAV